MEAVMGCRTIASVIRSGLCGSERSNRREAHARDIVSRTCAGRWRSSAVRWLY